MTEAETALLQGLKETDGGARLAKLNQAITLDPNLATVYYWSAAIYAATEHDKAAADFDTAISLDPKFVPAYVFRGVLYAFTSRAKEAEADWKKVLEILAGERGGQDASA